MDAAEAVAKCWPDAEDYEVARKGVANTVGGHAVVIVRETSQGFGKRAGWDDTTWIVDPGTCRKVGLATMGTLGSYEEYASVEGTPTPEERAWLLKNAGYVAYDPKRPEHALGGCSDGVAPADTELKVPGFPGKVTRLPAPVWHAGTVPTFTTSWCTLPPGSDANWYIVSPGGMSDTRSHPLLHTIATVARAPTGVQILEDPGKGRWAIVGDVVRTAGMTGSVPGALDHWYWERQYAELDPGVWRVVAMDIGTGKRWAFEVGVDDVVWDPAGLKLLPFEGEGEPRVIPTEVLRRAIVGRE